MNRKPAWIRYKTPSGPGYLNVKKCVSELSLHTICVEAKCPNAGDCFSLNTATFLILGNICTRNCLYCAVEKSIPSEPDPTEPERVAEAVYRLSLKYAVITSVTRDDLIDGGAAYFAETTKMIKHRIPDCKVELLIPDFKNNTIDGLDIIKGSEPDVLNHNIETVKEFFPRLRPKGDYFFSLDLLKRASNMGLTVKSGLMIGFGETIDDITDTMHDLFKSGCSILTVGQYLSPSRDHYKVEKYYHPDEFEEIRSIGERIGFKKVLSAPHVRSSYHASFSS
ncbi:MAG: lipoyl synthase [Leptospirales bacterium]|nr:lipoyl synthase [Leptospirales bacterium]